MKLIIAFISICCCCSWTGSAQDIHFSQFHHAPLLLNPSYTGLMEGNIRGSAIHRNQWSSVTTPFVTSAFAFDSRNWSDRLKGDAVGLGGIIAHDQSGDADFTMIQVLGSFSYFKKLDKAGNQAIIVGGQVGFFQKSIDPTQLVFASQFEDIDFNQALSSGESIPQFRFIQPDANAGLLYYHVEPGKYLLNGGISFYHLNQPKHFFLMDEDRLAIRKTYHATALFKTGKRTQAGPVILWMDQVKSRDFIFGGRVDYTLNPKSESNTTVLTLGTWYRSTGSDAMVLMGGLVYQNWTLGVSYDVNVSPLQVASGYRGGFEISIIYVNRLLFGKGQIPETLPCERL